MTRKHPLSRSGMTEATARLRRYLERQRLPGHHAPDLTRQVIEGYLSRKREDDVAGRNWSQLTWTLANMQIGEVHHFTGKSIQLIRQRYPSARKLADNRFMQWTARHLDTGECRVTRMADGLSFQRDPLDNPKVKELVSIEIGETIVSHFITATRGKGSLGSNCKVMARRYLKDNLAQWEVHFEADAIMIKRTR